MKQRTGLVYNTVKKYLKRLGGEDERYVVAAPVLRS
jgi:hypothetical protein